MRIVIQRVKYASVSVEGETTGACKVGFMVLWGATGGDTEDDAVYLSRKCCGLRVFEDDAGKMNVSLKDAGGTLLVIPNFTLYGNAQKGFRPSFTDAMEPESASRLYDFFCDECERNGIRTERGIFGADMKIEMLADGPITLIVDSKR